MTIKNTFLTSCKKMKKNIFNNFQKHKPNKEDASKWKWYLRKFYKKSLVIGDGKNLSSKLKTFGYSMALGTILVLSLLWIVSGNPFENFSDSFKNLFRLQSNIDRFLVNLSVFGLAGIAVGIGFKTGLFNMGVSGQMQFGGILSGLVALYAGKDIPFGLGQILVFFITIIGSMSFAAIAGALKAYFRIHEVVSTIMLNWIAFLLMQAIVKDLIPTNLLVPEKNKTIFFESSYTFLYNSTGLGGVPIKVGGVIAVALLVVSAITIWVILFKTNLGYKMQMVGKNKDAALAAGINIKNITISSMALSGAISGVLSIVIFFIRDLRLSMNLADVIPVEGFNGIAISILAFSNPFAILPISLIFGFLQALIVNSRFIDPNFVDLTIGLLLMIMALSSLFLRLKIRMFIHKILFGKERHALYLNFLDTRNELDVKFFEQYDNLKMDKKLKNVWSQVCHPHQKELLKVQNNYEKIRCNFTFFEELKKRVNKLIILLKKMRNKLITLLKKQRGDK